AAVLRQYGHLQRGDRLRAAREQRRLSAYYGLIGERAELDPAGPNGGVLSAAMLERLGTCPLSFFFRYVLELKPPEELVFDPARWLDALHFGRLVHYVLYRFVSKCIAGEAELSPGGRDALLEVVEEELARWRRLIPPPNEAAYVVQGQELRRTARRFLQMQQQWNACQRPVYLETGIGMSSEEFEGNELSSPEPVELADALGRTIRVRGQIDRIDQRHDGSFVIMDYKTGSPSKYEVSKAKPFQQGRLIQHALYLAVVSKRLEQCGRAGGDVSSFLYVFPTSRGQGDWIEFGSDLLEALPRQLVLLRTIMARGTFCPTNTDKDCRYCDYRPICGNLTDYSPAFGKSAASDPGIAAFCEIRGINTANQ
ncbi:MAG TPA: PD-(D/E)XK nuclease family protein, partial [Planctomycetaceae bacterium]|nr:PD-(D/E)XK nuclease family protein [Planctomycetaceae bacterium]